MAKVKFIEYVVVLGMIGSLVGTSQYEITRLENILMSHKVYKFRELNEEYQDKKRVESQRRMSRMQRRRDKEVFFVVETNKNQANKNFGRG